MSVPGERIHLVDVHLGVPLHDLGGLGAAVAARAQVWHHGVLLGVVEVPVTAGRCRAVELREAIVDELVPSFLDHVLDDLLAAGMPETHTDVDRRCAVAFALPHPRPPADLPSVTVAVCTRDRTTGLGTCLDALLAMGDDRVELLVVDNAPSDDATARLVRERYPSVRYVVEPIPGLNWARNRALREARGEIIAYTDDDVEVHPDWSRAIAAAFAEDPDLDAVTGLVLPATLDTTAQVAFERYGGFGRGYRPAWFRAGPDDTPHLGPGRFGTGANMAFRRETLLRLGGFDPALDVGTVTNGGGDLEMFFRVVEEGGTLRYEPAAVVAHHHRASEAALVEQITNHGVGLNAFFVRTARAYRGRRRALLRFVRWWWRFWYVQRSLRALVHPGGLSRQLALAELRGAVTGLRRYGVAARRAAELGYEAAHPYPLAVAEGWSRRAGDRPTGSQVSVETVDLRRPIPPLAPSPDAAGVRVFARRGHRVLGCVDVPARGGPVAASWLRDALVRGLSARLIADTPAQENRVSALAGVALAEALPLAAASAPSPPPLDSTVSASVVVATLNRPDHLERCLRSLATQRTDRRVEIVVVDNDPASGLTAPVVRQWPNVVLVDEPRRGLSSARNAGILAASGEIVVSTDDDVVLEPDWLEALLRPFARTDVGAVTGNVLPVELSTPAQRHFEEYGGLGRGFTAREYDRAWLEQQRSAAPTWDIGCTANAAFRATLFADPGIGLLDETLGPGTPAGIGEDTYLFYRVLKAGWCIVYTPESVVWHRHRETLPDLRRQLADYSRGHVAYHLTTMRNDGDLRVLHYLGLRLPLVQLRRAVHRLRGSTGYPLDLLWLEVRSAVRGPVALWRSARRLRRLRRDAVRTQAAPQLSEAATHH